MSKKPNQRVDRDDPFDDLLNSISDFIASRTVRKIVVRRRQAERARPCDPSLTKTENESLPHQPERK
ncbi:hypothetical protein [Piscinibacter gummiphilus]|uniref:Uncharacterized protein n=1 Tax=Piscinibacter gummiphilus TaxID=946333 RepID=A0ABZ0D7S8_9BURK|nr:hypothetical protein [Piscinibacter gummiphilus]WOB11400.1 hypothetical protein RXV79_27840 [Piscinibacter gummiphilus]